MSAEITPARDPDPVDLTGKGEPLPAHILDDPKLQEQIREARGRIDRGETRPGMTAAELLDIAHERKPAVGA